MHRVVNSCHAPRVFPGVTWATTSSSTYALGFLWSRLCQQQKIPKKAQPYLCWVAEAEGLLHIQGAWECAANDAGKQAGQQEPGNNGVGAGVQRVGVTSEDGKGSHIAGSEDASACVGGWCSRSIRARMRGGCNAGAPLVQRFVKTGLVPVD